MPPSLRRNFSDRATAGSPRRYQVFVAECLAPSQVPDPLEQRLTSALPRLRAHLVRRAPGAEHEDIAQEVMTRALRYRDSFDPTRELWPWLRRMADRVLHDHHSAAQRRPAALESHEPAAREESPVLDERDQLQRWLRSLTERERDVLLRFHQREQSIQEIASETGMPTGTIKSHLSRARRRLAELTLDEEAAT